jgi:hypothetical protein
MDADALEKFDEEIGMRVNPETQAREALAAYQKAMGMTFENPDAPVAPDEKARAWMQDEEIKGNFMGQK